MALPGFSADASLGFTTRQFAGLPSFGPALNLVQPMQEGIGLPIIPNPDVAPINPSPDWPFWPPYYPREEPPPPPRIPPDIIIDVLKATGEAAVAVGIGIAIGAGIGLGVEKLITQPVPTPGAVKPTCKTVGPPTLRRIQETWWSCERSLSKTIQSANAVCASLPNQCAGPCPPGSGPCVATATITNGPVQTSGWTGCETFFWYTCDCGC